MSKIILIFSALILLLTILSGCSTDTREAWEKIEVRESRTCVVYECEDEEEPASLEITPSKRGATGTEIEGNFHLKGDYWIIEFDTRMLQPGKIDEEIFLRACVFTITFKDNTVGKYNVGINDYKKSYKGGHIIHLPPTAITATEN
ncbi:hypothetical protein ACFL24_01890 [Patescibacteria group bacterium]